MDGYRCVFRVRCEFAQQVKLVIEYRPGLSQIFSLQPCGDGVWETALALTPGEYRFCYHAYNGRSLNYLIPPEHELDGLKAVLRVGDTPQTEQATPATRWLHQRVDAASPHVPVESRIPAAS